MSNNLKLFTEKCLLIDPEIMEILPENDSNIENVSCFKRKISGIIYPKTSDHVAQILRLSSLYEIKLYPVSTGFNWGFGSAAPVEDEGFILKLSRMKQISNYDEKFGTISIEPGVSQKELSVFLKNSNAKYFLDITGSSEDTSVIGNAMDRGISYCTHRCDSIINLEVVLANGEILKTGYQNWESSKITNLYKYAPGPFLDGMFFQSNLGVVVKVTYQLQPIQDKYLSFNLSFNSDKLEEVIEAFYRLKRKIPLNNLIHIANRERVQFNLSNITNQYPANFIDNFFSNLIPKLLGKKEWMAFGTISGSGRMNQLLKSIINDELNSIAKVSWRNSSKLLIIFKLLNFIKLRKFSNIIKSILDISKINEGEPTNLTISPFLKNNTLPVNANLVDKYGTGFIYCVGMAPLNGYDARKMLDIINIFNIEHSIMAEVTLNIIDRNILESVVSVSFDRSDKKQTDNAQNYINLLQKKLILSGYPPYRTNINSMDQIPYSSTQRKIYQSLKNEFDPKNLLAPGRYNL